MSSFEHFLWLHLLYPSPDPHGSFIPLNFLWAGSFVAFILIPDIKMVPISIMRGILQPGSLSSIRSLLL